MSVGAFLFSLFSFYGFGIRLLPDPLKRNNDTPLRALLASALGMFLFSLWVFLLGNLKLLQFYPISPFLLVGSVLAFFSFKKGITFRAFKIRLQDSSFLFWFLPGALLIVLSAIALSSPMIGNDALAYHLYFPKIYAESGAIVHDPTHTRSLWPFVMEMLFTAGLILEGPTLAKSYSWLTAVLTVLMVPASMLTFVGKQKATLFAFLLIISVPAIWMQSLYPYVDNAMMLYAFCSFIALWIWKERGFARKEGVIAGLFLSALLGIKYYTLIYVLILFPFFGVDLFRTKNSLIKKIAALSVPMVIMLFFGGFWFVRSYFTTGNPFFPFLHTFFNDQGFSPRAVGYAVLTKNALNFLLLPWKLSLNPETFGGEPLGCLFLAAIPLAISWKKEPSFAKTSLLFALLQMVAWFFATQQARFFLPVLPFLAVFFGSALAQKWEELPYKKHYLFSFVALLILHFGLAAYYPIHQMRETLRFANPVEQTQATERSFNFFEKISPLLSKEDKILSIGEGRFFYAPVKMIFYSPTLDVLRQKADLSFTQWLKKEGVTHILIKSDDLTKKLHPSLALENQHLLQARVSEIYRGEVHVTEGWYLYSLWKIEDFNNQDPG